MHTIGGEIVVSADVPTVGWRVVFTQRRSAFVRPLAGPLQTAGIVLVLLLLLIGLTLTAVLARRLRQAREEEKRMRELHRAQDEFISVVSHELRTPVSGVLGFLQTTLDHWEVMSEDERLNAVQRAFTNARRLQAMARDVLDTESMESGQFDDVRNPIDLADEMRTAVEGFDSGPTGVTLVVPDAPVIVQAIRTGSSRCSRTCSRTPSSSPSAAPRWRCRWSSSPGPRGSPWSTTVPGSTRA